MRPASELAWVAADYVAAGQEPPERLLSNPTSCEGEVMSDAEIEQFISDGIGVLMVLRDKRSPRLEAVWHSWLADLEFLLAIGRIERDQYNELIDETGYQF